MKLQRSRFRLISLALFCAFVLVVLLCVRQTGVLHAAQQDGPDAGVLPDSEESLTQSVDPAGSDPAAPSPAPDEIYDVSGL